MASLFQSGLNRGYWEDAARLAVLCETRVGELPQSNINKGFPKQFSRLERLHNVSIPTRLNGIYPLGVLAYARVPKELRKKFEPRAVACLYLGLHTEVKGVRLMQLDQNKIMVTTVFTVSEGHFPLMISTVATPSKEFILEHAARDTTESATNIWPAIATNADLLSLPAQNATITPQPLPVPSSRPKRQWTPSSEALQRIATEADIADRRTHAGNVEQPDGDAEPLLAVTASSHSQKPLDHDDPETLMFLNPVTPWILENDDFLAESCSIPMGTSVTAREVILNAINSNPEVPLNRHEYLAHRYLI